MEVKVSFDVTNNCNRGDFLSFLDVLKKNKFDLYIITKDQDSNFIQSIADRYELDSNKVINCNTDLDKTNAITNNNINIHLDNDLKFVTSNNDRINKRFCIYTRNIYDHYRLDMFYSVQFNFIIERYFND